MQSVANSASRWTSAKHVLISTVGLVLDGCRCATICSFAGQLVFDLADLQIKKQGLSGGDRADHVAPIFNIIHLKESH
ncbi:hypothetical protein ABBQ38_15526 [Trebouxia sp. C0009 RCD-2024]